LRDTGAQSGGNAATLVNITGSGSSTTVTPSGTLWAFALYSRYIRPNAVRVATSGAPTGTDIAAFKNTDGTIAVVMVNTGSSSQSVTLGGVSIASVDAYVMDNSVSSPTSLSTSISDDNVVATLPAYSLVTFVITT
jgi:O-glycosyl hydrolase